MLIYNLMEDKGTFVSQFSFGNLLAHTFPGILLMCSIFMIMDWIFPQNIILGIFSRPEKFIGSIGIMILFGTVLGVIVDLFHHSPTFQNFVRRLEGESTARKKFDKLIEYVEKGADEELKLVLRKNKKKTNSSQENEEKSSIGVFYLLPWIGLQNYKHLLEEYYYYSEFSANLAIVTMPFLFGFMLFLQEYLLFNLFAVVFWLMFLFIVFGVGYYIVRLCIKWAAESEDDFWDSYIEIVCGMLVLRKGEQ